MLDLHHGSIERIGRGGCELNGGCDADASLTAAAIQVREAQTIGGGGYRCEAEEANYGTLGANPVVLQGRRM